MAEKISKLAIEVDLSCKCCYKKIQKILCKLQERENIKSISYDEKKNTVTISGPFDPQKLSKKLWCKGCRVIRNIQIIVDPPPKPPPPPPKEPCKVINDIKIVVCDDCKDPKCSVQTSCKKEAASKKETGEKKEEKPKKGCCRVINDIDVMVWDPKCCDEKPKDTKTTEPESSTKPVPCCPPVPPGCCMKPCHVGCQGGSRGCPCGQFYGCAIGAPYSATSRGGFQLVCEEDPYAPCTIM